MARRVRPLPRLLLLVLLLVAVFVPIGCLGCGSDRDAAEVKDPLTVLFPEESKRAFQSDDALVPVGTDAYARGANGMETAERRLEASLPVEGHEGIRFTAADGFVVVFRSLDGLGRATLTDGVVTYAHEGGGQIWTPKEGGFDVSLFLGPGFVAKEPFVWHWEVDGARVRLQDDDVAVLDDQGIERLRLRLLEAREQAGERVETRLDVQGREVHLAVPKTRAAVLVRMRVEPVENAQSKPPVSEENVGQGQPCGIGATCDPGLFCVDGVCCNLACTETCKSCNIPGFVGFCNFIGSGLDPNNECANGSCNGMGVCRRDNGQPCQAAVECSSNICVDGVCCDTACTGQCSACTVPQKGQGIEGTCGPILIGLDPDNECAGSCDGMGGCKLDNGTACISGAQCISGWCVDGVCCNTSCTDTCKACNLPGQPGTCANVAQNQTDPTTCAGLNQTCDGAGACKSKNGEGCTLGSTCLSGFCVDGVCCNNACPGTCFGCNVAGNVGSCAPIPSGNDDFFPPDACVGADKSCNGSGLCKRFNGAQCNDFAECLSGFCVDGICCSSSDCPNCQACNVENNKGTCWNIPANSPDTNASPQCTGTTACDGGGACKRRNGVACSNGDGTQCISGFCVDGVCCNSACNGTCQACTSLKKGAGIDGTCGDIQDGTDPDAECGAQPVSTCGNTGACQNGTCQKYSQGTTCAAAYCSPDGLTQFNVRSCDGNGVCNPVTTTICAPYICSGTACLAGCSKPEDCIAAAYCDNAGACQYKKPNGAACTAAVQCTSGQCVDGFCCNSNCIEECKTCKASGNEGTCVNVQNGSQDNTCQAMGQACDGSGTCKKDIGQPCTVSTECLSNACVDGFCCNTDCLDKCWACSIAKKGAGNTLGNGHCEPVAAKTDPNNGCGPSPVTTCGDNGFCDGTGLCQKYDSTTVCAPPTCKDAFTLNGPNLCNNGFCNNISTDCKPYVCKNNACQTTCAMDMDCATDAYCEMQQCKSKKPNGQTCAAAGQCQNGNCVDGVCCATAACPDCAACNLKGDGTCTSVPTNASDGACTGADRACDGLGTCKKTNAQSCQAPTDCVSGNCVDGVCCNEACTTTCKTCNVVGSVGTCANIVKGQDDGTCIGIDQSCDGIGNCQKEPGQPCADASVCLSGKCIDGVCCNDDCTGTCQACNVAGKLGQCSNVPENSSDETCPAGTSCNSAQACVQSLGTACTTNDQCSSKHCIDGVCCENECTDDCKSCKNAEGKCTNVPEGVEDLDTCTGGSACNGEGVCRIQLGQPCGVDTQCLSGICAPAYPGSDQFEKVCCDAPCASACVACTVTGGATADGTCTPLTNEPCDDGDACTQTDTCQSGMCTGANEIVCGEPGECQREGVCNRDTGVCDYAPLGPECTEGKDATGGGCACSIIGQSGAESSRAWWVLGMIALATLRRRTSKWTNGA